MNLNIETKRLETFNNWKIPFIDKNQLALFGFYYYGPGDMVKCYFCQIEIGMWEEGDDILTDHMRWSRHCKLICRATTNNIPINETLLLESLPLAPSPDVGGWALQDPYDNGPNDPLDIDRNVEPAAHPVNNLNFAIEANRFESFKNWPISMQQKPHQLSDAGFYYTGVGDKVCCYYCGGGLKDWEKDDDPWENHAMWYGKCKYVSLMKGESFIHQMSEKRELLLNKTKLVSSKKVDTLPAWAAARSDPEGPPLPRGWAAPLPRGSLRDPSLRDPSLAAGLRPVRADRPLGGGGLAPDHLRWRGRGAAQAPPRSGRPQPEGFNPPSSQIEKNDENGKCKICYENNYNTVFIPCGHIISCAKCSLSVTKCPACRQPFENVINIYFS